MADLPQAQAPSQESPSSGTNSLTPSGGRLSDHFTVAELTHTDTGLPNDPPMAIAGNMVRLAELLEGVRELAGVPIKVLSAYRSESVNSAVGGVATSEHRYGRAADIYPLGLDISHLFGLIRRSGLVWNQLILEYGKHSTWIHISTPPAREKGKQQVMVSTINPVTGKRGYINA